MSKAFRKHGGRAAAIDILLASAWQAILRFLSSKTSNTLFCLK
jgi:hypothetical protein